MASLLYTRAYITALRAIPVRTSNMECCLMNRVDRMMERASTREAALIPLRPFSSALRTRAK